MSMSVANDWWVFCFQHKFTRLSLAFKTDRMTLENRLGIQQRQRDDAERNVAREVSELRGKLNVSIRHKNSTY